MTSLTSDNRRFLHPTASAATSLAIIAMPTFLLGAFAPTIKDELGFGDTALGAIFTTGYLVSAITMQLTGQLADTRGPGRSLRLGLLIAGTGSMAMAVFGEGYWLILIIFLVIRVGDSLVHPASNALVSVMVPPPQQGRAFGIKQAAIPFSTALAGLAVPVLGGSIGWRGALAIVAILAIPTYLLVPRNVPMREKPARTRSDLWRLRHLQAISIGGALGAASVVTVAGFLTTAAEDAGFSEQSAGLLLAAGGVVMIASRLAWGWLADRFAFDRFLGVAVALAIGSGAYLLFATQQKWALVVGSLIVFGVGWSWPGLMILGVAEKHPNEPASATAVLQSSVRIGALGAPLAFGAVIDSAGFTAAWMMTFAFALAGAVMMVVGAAAARKIDPDEVVSSTADEGREMLGHDG
ncbi:MAG: MFS transporter [Acidimicrobiales bacterium]